MKKVVRLIARILFPPGLRLRVHILSSYFRHKAIISKIRRKLARGEKIKVIFLSSENSKWKCQSLYDLMKSSRWCDPLIGIMKQDADIDGTVDEIKRGIGNAERFFEKIGCQTICVYNAEKGEYFDLRAVSPDVVIYQQPWNVEGSIWPMQLAKYALPCYIPYFLPNYIFPDIAYKQDFHRHLAHYFVLNQAECALGESVRGFLDFAGDLQAVGHPMLDDFYLNPVNGKHHGKPCIIYAPHFSIPNPNRIVFVHYSTFLETGECILRYAKQHPEMNWVFKPHPVLKSALKSSGIWTEEKIATYYSDWEKVGCVCESGDYIDVFRRATAMITDCGSFLTEFAATGQPIIRLVNPENKQPYPPLYDTYYNVHNNNELEATLREVLEKGMDSKRDKRLKAVAAANLTGQYAAKNIMVFFAKEFGIKNDC